MEHVQFIKVTCELQKEICDNFKIEEYPTLKYVLNGRVYEYKKDRNEFLIKDWIKGEYKQSESKPLQGFETWMYVIMTNI